MTQNQKFLKLGPDKGSPKKATIARMNKRGVVWLDRFRTEHQTKMQRSAARTHLRKLEEIKRLKAEQQRDRD